MKMDNLIGGKDNVFDFEHRINHLPNLPESRLEDEVAHLEGLLKHVH